LSAFNLVNAAAVGFGAIVGSQLFVLLGSDAGAYWWLFGISALARLMILPVLRGTSFAAVAPSVELRTLAIRPSAGAIQRPILASFDGYGDGGGDGDGGAQDPDLPACTGGSGEYERAAPDRPGDGAQG
jgi:hypothetical protein